MALYVSDLLTATAAPVSAAPTSTRTWQWLRGSSAISGATSDAYTAVTADIGSPLAASQIETNVAGTATATSAATETVQAFDPIRLFSASEPGVWYDPNDISTLFKGPTVQAPVTTPGDTVWLMLDKSQGLVLGPELVDASTQTLATATGTLSGAGYNITATGSFCGIVQPSVLSADKFYRVRAKWSGNTNGRTIAIYVGGSGGSSSIFVAGTAVSGDVTFTASKGTQNNSCYFQINNSVSGDTFYLELTSVKELPGNHATQATTASQPTYGIVPAGGRRNLLTQTEAFDTARWTKSGVTVSGNQVACVGGFVGRCSQLVPISGGTANKVLTAYVTVSGSGTFRLKNTHSGVVDNFSANITATSTPQTVVLTVTNGASAGNGSQDIAITTSTTNAAFDLTVHQFQLEQSATATPYQRVTTQYDVTEAGVASLGYLQFDGISNFMSTGTITPGTDKVQVFAGVRKLSDAASGTVLDINGLAGIGSIMLRAPSGALANFAWYSGGSLQQGAVSPSSYAAPITKVITGIGDISGDLAALRVDGVQAVQTTLDQGTGNFSNLPLYLGRRQGADVAFNGHIHSLIVRFGPNLTPARISATESWVASKTAGVTL